VRARSPSTAARVAVDANRVGEGEAERESERRVCVFKEEEGWSAAQRRKERVRVWKRLKMEASKDRSVGEEEGGVYRNSACRRRLPR